MTRKEHARILNAYLSRLTNKDLAAILEADNHCWHAQLNYGNSGQLEANLAAILEADNHCWHAQLNYGNSGQLEAQSKFYDVVSKAVDNITDYDLTIIETITEQVTV